MGKLFNESGGSNLDRATEADDLVKILSEHYEEMTQRERTFIEQLDSALDRDGGDTPVSPKKLFWLRDLRDKYCL